MLNNEEFFIENLLKIINFSILCQLKGYLRIWIEEINDVSLKECEIIFEDFHYSQIFILYIYYIIEFNFNFTHFYFTYFYVTFLSYFKN